MTACFVLPSGLICLRSSCTRLNRVMYGWSHGPMFFDEELEGVARRGSGLPNASYRLWLICEGFSHPAAKVFIDLSLLVFRLDTLIHGKIDVGREGTLVFVVDFISIERLHDRVSKYFPSNPCSRSSEGSSNFPGMSDLSVTAP